MVQKGQKQERMVCGVLFAVCGLDIQRYCTIVLLLGKKKVAFMIPLNITSCVAPYLDMPPHM